MALQSHALTLHPKLWIICTGLFPPTVDTGTFVYAESPSRSIHAGSAPIRFSCWVLTFDEYPWWQR